jgi:lysophospholipase L1-like esterase
MAPLLITALITCATLAMYTHAQTHAKYFKGPNPRHESRIFGSSGNFRSEELESSQPRYPEPFRLLIAGDDHAHGCGWKSYPPSYDFDNCSSFDEGFRVELVQQIQERTGIEVITVGSFHNPVSLSQNVASHEGRPGLTIDNITSTVEWKKYQPDLILLYAGTTDIVALDSASTMAAKYEDLLLEVRRQLPNVRVVVSSILDQGKLSNPELRHNIHAFNRKLPLVVNKLRGTTMELGFVDVGSLLPKLCVPGSRSIIQASNVPICSTREMNPTHYGYSQMASLLAAGFDEMLSLDGTCRGRPGCDNVDRRLWRNRIDGGLRVVTSYQSS